MNSALNNPEGNGLVTISDGNNNIPVTFNVNVIPTTRDGAIAQLNAQSGDKIQEQTNNFWELTNTQTSGMVQPPGSSMRDDAYSNVQTIGLSSPTGYETVLLNLLCVDLQFQNGDGQISAEEVRRTATNYNIGRAKKTESLKDLSFSSYDKELNSPIVNSALTNVVSGTLGNRVKNMTDKTSINLP